MTLAPFVAAVKQSRLLAPNLRKATFKVYTTNSTRANITAKLVMRDHLAALRWMNPNAAIHLKEIRGSGKPVFECTLCASRPCAQSAKQPPAHAPHLHHH